MPFWKRKSKKENPSANPASIKPGTSYFVKGEDVVFDLNSLDFTFEGFYAQVVDDAFYIHVRGEVPMNLLYLLNLTESGEQMSPEVLGNAESVDFTLQLKAELFSELSTSILSSTEIIDVFSIKLEGNEPLKQFKNYIVKKWTSSG